MKVLELFSGTESVSNEFRKRGHEAFTVDWGEGFSPSMSCDIEYLEAEEVLEKFGRPDVVFAAFDCTTFSRFALWRHRLYNRQTGEYDAVSWQARKADRTDKHCLQLIEKLQPKVFIIENPVGAMRHMRFMNGIPRYTTPYCQWGFEYKKPTDFFSNIDLRLTCRCNHKRHSMTVRDVKTARERSMYPQALVEHIVDVVEEFINHGAKYGSDKK